MIVYAVLNPHFAEIRLYSTLPEYLKHTQYWVGRVYDYIEFDDYDNKELYDSIVSKIDDPAKDIVSINISVGDKVIC